MPSRRQTFFTLVDEANLSAALKQKFPSIRFVDPRLWSRKEIVYIDGIQFGTSHEVRMFIPHDGWEPTFRELEYHPGKFGVANYPEEWMRFYRSGIKFMGRDPIKDGAPPVLSQGCIQVGKSDVMTAAEKSLRNKVWRIMSKISTPRLKVRRDWRGDDPWIPIGGQIDCAGLDAVRWALEDESRMFKTGFYFRPADDFEL